MKRILLILLLLLMACEPSPKSVSDAIVRGRVDEAVQRLAELLNSKEEITASHLDQLLESIKANRHFNIDAADDLMDRLKPEGRRAVFPWYMKTYLELVEVAIRMEKFDAARSIWKRNQKVRALLFPSFQEATPVLGIIDLREAEYWLNKKNKAKARQLLAAARKKLTRSRPFDRVQQYNFKRSAEDLTRKLK
ncbi:MAG: hypothetical protein ACAI44_06955 [Candidatus Sericytochromatia bacterium]